MTSRRKLIDIEEDVCKMLSVKAATQGISLKKYIENLLVSDAEKMKNTDIFKALFPNGMSPHQEGKKRGRPRKA